MVTKKKKRIFKKTTSQQTKRNVRMLTKNHRIECKNTNLDDPVFPGSPKSKNKKNIVCAKTRKN